MFLIASLNGEQVLDDRLLNLTIVDLNQREI